MHGEKPDGSPWRMCLHTPHADQRTALGIIRGQDITAVTSGVDFSLVDDSFRSNKSITQKT